MKAMTAPSSSQTLLTLPPPPLLRLVALAAQRQCTALWPSLASTLIFRMAPTPGIFRKNRSQDIVDKEEAEKQAALQMVAETLHILIGVIAPMLLDQGGLHANPDVAESFFKFATAVSHHVLAQGAFADPELPANLGRLQVPLGFRQESSRVSIGVHADGNLGSQLSGAIYTATCY